jgi:hypothetical protein
MTRRLLCTGSDATTSPSLVRPVSYLSRDVSYIWSIVRTATGLVILESNRKETGASSYIQVVHSHFGRAVHIIFATLSEIS